MDRGHYKIFLGMAAGVGKTYRMLQEGHAEVAAGRDVAIGYLEPHKRQETSDQARGLEVVPRRKVTYREVEVEEKQSLVGAEHVVEGHVTMADAGGVAGVLREVVPYRGRQCPEQVSLRE